MVKLSHIIKSGLISIIILIIGALGYYYLIATKPIPVKQVIKKKPTLVKTQMVNKNLYPPVLSLYGIVEAPTTSTISAETTGKILSITVKEGQTAKINQVLVQIDSADLKLQKQQRQADILDIKAQISAAKINLAKDKLLEKNEKQVSTLSNNALKRQEQLIKIQHTSEETLEKNKTTHLQQVNVLKRLEHDIQKHQTTIASLKAKLKKSQSLLQQVELDIRKTYIKAPYQGVIKDLYVAKGEYVQPSQNLLAISNHHPLEVRTLIPQKYTPIVIESFHQGKNIAATIKLYGITINMQLDRLSKKISANRIGIDAIFNITSQNHYLSMGQKIALDLYLPNTQPFFSLPSTAFYHSNTIFKVTDDHLIGYQIKREGYTIIDNKKYVLFSSNQITNGDKIVTSLMSHPMTGQQVKSLND